jgi:Ala-tRNA(Pro) deacylase
VPLNSLRQYLDQKEIRYVVISHSLAYTAQGVAHASHISGQEIAKTVIVKVDGCLAMVVISASRLVDLRRLKEMTGSRQVELASETDFQNAFADCETGAMPPFGNLYDVPVYFDQDLTWDEEIAFNAGTHRELIKMRLEDYLRLVKPDIAPLAAGTVAAHAA